MLNTSFHFVTCWRPSPSATTIRSSGYSDLSWIYLVPIILLIMSTTAINNSGMDWGFLFSCHTLIVIYEKKQQGSTCSAKTSCTENLPKENESDELSIPTPLAAKVGQSEQTSTTSFTYLGSVISQDGGATMDTWSRLNKARGVFASNYESIRAVYSTYVPLFFMDQSVSE